MALKSLSGCDSFAAEGFLLQTHALCHRIGGCSGSLAPLSTPEIEVDIRLPDISELSFSYQKKFKDGREG